MKKPPIFYLIESVKITIWIAIIAKVFFVDFDELIVSHWFPQGRWFLDHGFLFSLFMFALALIFMGGKKIAYFVSSILLYPFLLAWRLTKRFAIHWPILFAIIPALHELSGRIKAVFISYVFFLFSILVIFTSDWRPSIVISLCYLAVFLTLHYASAIKRAYAANVFRGMAKFAGKIRMAIADGILEKRPRTKNFAEIEALNQVDNKATIAQVEHRWTYYLTDNLINYIESKFTDFTHSRKFELMLMVSLVYTFLLTTVTFALIYSAIFMLNAQAFSIGSNTSFWSFLGLSLSRMTASGLSELVAHSNLAIAASHFQSVFQMGMIVLFVFILLTSKRERFYQGALEFKEELTKIAKAIEERVFFVTDQTLEAVELDLSSSNGSVVNFIRKLRGKPEMVLVGSTDSGTIVTPSDSPSSANQIDIGVLSERKGFVYPPGREPIESNLVDVRDFNKGQKVRDPVSLKIFIVP
ncbi:hypothetical protein FEM03_02615 [Phragmitibacter flavus]|uniref:Uncharacterized protein n=1 Tax=Phragmitibacter flavus TaxID=2576071 RepID=A0A5R8KJ40_9BACT|nr:hypothetical protein [Phragmitibacter flavus]TLD72267.1 hypothetical protein FEM03_02615 [Phragmitibacter flavus]